MRRDRALRAPAVRSRARRLRLLVALGLVLAVLVLVALGVEPRVPEVRRTALGSGAVPFQITQLSDLHLRADDALNAQIAACARSAGGDLVVLTGDVVDRPDRLGALDRFLAALGGAVPVLATTGNWEHWSHVDLGALADIYARHDVQLLRDQRVRLAVGAGGRALDVVGLDDPRPRDAVPAALLAGTDDVPLLVLAHHPATAAAAALALAGRRDRPLVLAGHTHGGQVAIFGWAPTLPPGSAIDGQRAVDGAYPRPAADIWVSRGVGTSILDVRWGVPATVEALAWAPG